MWFLFQFALIFWAIGMPVILWRRLGDDIEYLEGFNPSARKLLGIKIFTGVNGRTYAEPPPPMKRLTISLLFGLAWAAMLAGVFYWPAVWFLSR